MIKDFVNRLFSSPPKQETQQVIYQQQKVFLYEPNEREIQKAMESSDMDGNAPGYVYFVQEYMNGTFKIGKTKYVDKRMNLFSVKLPFENKLIHLVKTGDHHKTEKAFHHHFSEKRVEGEWFSLSKEDVDWIKNGHYSKDILHSIHQNRQSESVSFIENQQEERLPLTNKQQDYAKILLKKLENEYTLVQDFSSLTTDDLKRLSVYFRYKNKGALVNLVKQGVLKPK
ncbi:GIY-YIG nuclease family protein [Jeotgalibacillus proteolyticus]|uniref:GIY-YIG nuclease family protein n=1 Tax=Jeotgalibacillus proteolyticus TaxID=2082395 RepID=UPI003CECCA90